VLGVDGSFVGEPDLIKLPITLAKYSRNIVPSAALYRVASDEPTAMKALGPKECGTTATAAEPSLPVMPKSELNS